MKHLESKNHFYSLFVQKLSYFSAILFIFFIFLLYIIGISRMPDIQRVFMYHGAEHKAIYNLESGRPLNVENARDKSTLQPRCGTSFLLIVLVISILVFALLGEGSLLWRVGSRLAMFPVVAGLGYEFIKLTGTYADSWWRAF